MLIITDVETRKAFDIVNISSIDFDNIRLTSNASIFSRLILSLIYRKLIYNQKKILNSKKIGECVILPVEEETISHLYSIPNAVSQVKIGHKYYFDIFRNKKLFCDFCIQNNLKIPVIFSEAELKNISHDRFPLIAKPSVGSGSIGIKILHTHNDVSNFLCSKDNVSDYIVQEYLPNSVNVVGYFALCDDGNIIDEYAHIRLRTYPLDGGVTIYSKIFPVDGVRSISHKLINISKWSGFIMLEYLKKNDDWVLIEANPRPWGSIMLSEFSGHKFIRKYVYSVLSYPCKSDIIKEEAFIRWIFPWDFIHLINKNITFFDFFKFSTKNTCYINFTYSNFAKSILFNLYCCLSFVKIKKFILKVKN